MGIPITPTPDPFADDCLDCYPAGGTPLIVYAIFKGISQGVNWVPGMPPPPNDVFELIQHGVDPCRWTYNGDKWHVAYEAVILAPPVPGSGLSVGTQEEVPKMGFTAWIDKFCHASFQNEPWPPPLQYYTGGAGWIFTLTI